MYLDQINGIDHIKQQELGLDQSIIDKYPDAPCMAYFYTYIWLIFGVNVGKYSIHGAYGIWLELSPASMGYNSITGDHHGIYHP